MNFHPTEPQSEATNRARSFVEREVLPHATDWDRAGQIPRDVLLRLGESGVLGGPLPKQYGGGGWDSVSMACAYEELGAGDQSIRGFVSVQLGLVAQCLEAHGTEEQKQRWLPGLATAEAIGCYALTESGAGSDVASMETVATADGDGWRISGEKIWITNGGIADVSLVFAKTDPQARHKGITAFVVPTDREGFAAHPVEGSLLGHRASDHARLTFDNLRVDASDILGELDRGFGVAMSALDFGRLGVAAGGVGTARFCLESMLEHGRKRRQFGKRIGDFQMIQERIADIAAATEAARLLVYKAAWLRDRGEDVTQAVSMAKLYATDVAQRAAETALLVLASRGYSDGCAVERHYRDIPGLRIYEGTNLIQRLVVARDLLGPDPLKNKERS